MTQKSDVGPETRRCRRTFLGEAVLARVAAERETNLTKHSYDCYFWRESWQVSGGERARSLLQQETSAPRRPQWVLGQSCRDVCGCVLHFNKTEKKEKRKMTSPLSLPLSHRLLLFYPPFWLHFFLIFFFTKSIQHECTLSR